MKSPESFLKGGRVADSGTKERKGVRPGPESLGNGKG